MPLCILIPFPSRAPASVSRVVCKERPGADHRPAEDRRPGQPHEPQTAPRAAGRHRPQSRYLTLFSTLSQNKGIRPVPKNNEIEM